MLHFDSVISGGEVGIDRGLVWICVHSWVSAHLILSRREGVGWPVYMQDLEIGDSFTAVTSANIRLWLILILMTDGHFVLATCISP